MGWGWYRKNSIPYKNIKCKEVLISVIIASH